MSTGKRVASGALKMGREGAWGLCLRWKGKPDHPPQMKGGLAANAVHQAGWLLLLLVPGCWCMRVPTNAV